MTKSQNKHLGSLDDEIIPKKTKTKKEIEIPKPHWAEQEYWDSLTNEEKKIGKKLN